ncbi:hypothetical protein D3C81_2216310 [compost metagenome]
MNFDLIVRATARQLHMLITRRDIGMPRQDAFAILCLFHANLTQLVQTFGE